jgi:SAM-dependent methyltransferase
MPQALYDRIGKTYASTRHSDPRIAAAITRALGDSRTVINVGAGTGAYEPTDRAILAVEPSAHMIRQRKTEAAFIVQASAEALPFRDDTFDAALALLTVHHWTDWRRGLDEMRRVADRLVVFTFEPGDLGNFWLTDTSFPEIVELVRARCPSVADLAHHLGDCSVDRVAIPHDCADGFLAGYWRRPEAYLDPQVRAGIRALRSSIRTLSRRALRSSGAIGIRGLGRSVRPPRRLDTLDVLPNPVDWPK